MPTKQEVIDAYRKVMQRGEKLAAGLSEEDWQKPVYGSAWSVKQTFCHLASVGAAPLFFISMAQRPAGEGGGSGFDVDAWNAEQVTARQDRPVAEIMQEFRNSHEGGIRTVEATGDDVLARQIPTFEGGEASVLEVLMASGSEHEMGHMDDIERALRGG